MIRKRAVIRVLEEMTNEYGRWTRSKEVEALPKLREKE